MKYNGSSINDDDLMMLDEVSSMISEISVTSELTNAKVASQLNILNYMFYFSLLCVICIYLCIFCELFLE